MEYRKIFNDYLRGRGLRLTRVRQIIVDAVFATHSHFDAEELYDLVRNNDVSRATVYRTIPFLVDSGLVKRSMFGLNKEKYEHVYGHPDHFHLLCRMCGRVVEQIDDDIESSIRRIAKDNGFEYEDYNLRISGICALCKNKKNTE